MEERIFVGVTESSDCVRHVSRVVLDREPMARAIKVGVRSLDALHAVHEGAIRVGLGVESLACVVQQGEDAAELLLLRPESHAEAEDAAEPAADSAVVAVGSRLEVV